MRLRTLPLSAAGVLLGLMLACADYQVPVSVIVLTVTTAVFLQILSNVSNELGDALSGTDGDLRQGPDYPLMQGKLSVRDFKTMIWIYAVCSCVSGLILVRVSFGTFFSLESLMLIILGAMAISSAMRYTLGSSPYGYKGLGDLYVFLFFGLVSVLGSYFVAAHTVKTWLLFLPAVSIGTFSMGVLNVNNMRDMNTDAATRKTIPVRIGLHKAKIYQTILILCGWSAMVLYSAFRFFDPFHYLFLLSLPLFLVHLLQVWKSEGSKLDRALPLLSISTLLFSILSGLGYLIYLF